MPEGQPNDRYSDLGRKDGAGGIGVQQESPESGDGSSSEVKDPRRSDPGIPVQACNSDSSEVFPSGFPRGSEGDTSLLRDLLAEPSAVVEDGIPGYEIVREVHRGGQGVVYQAIQRTTKRKVAIKVMREGPFAGKRDMARFEREVEVLGQLNHPRIVNIHDSGVAAGSHYFVMDYISGQPLDEWVTAKPRTIREILHLFARVCEAVNAAHLRGIIHRDLKPGNILVDYDGEPHVLDFGLAKVATVAEASVMTVTGQFIGSLPWASPEQAEAIPAKIDLRTDVYSLGVILFQMLTGRLPYGITANMLETLDHIVNTEATRPSTIRREIDDEIDTIILKCLSKDRERRYQTAGELARDIRHYLSGEAIEAKRDRPLYVLRKYLRRYRLPVAVAAGFAVMLAVSVLTAVVLLGQVTKERAIAQERKRFAQLVSANSELEQGTTLHLIGRIVEARSAFVRARDNLAELHLSTLPVEVGLYRSFRDFGAPINTLSGHSDGLMAVAWLPDGLRACSASEDGTIKLWDVCTGREIRTFVGHSGAVHGLAVSPDGKFILSGGEDASVRFWNVETGEEDRPPFTQTGPVRGVAFSPDGRFFLSAPATPGGAVQLGNVQSRTVVRSFRSPSDDSFYGVAFASDGCRVLATTYEKNIWIWDSATGQVLQKLSGHTGYVISAVFSPDGDRVLSASYDQTLRLWNAHTGRELRVFKGHAAGARGAAFVGQGDRALSCSMDGSLRLWNVDTGEVCRTLAGHAGGVRGLAVTSDGRRAVSAGIDRTVRVWDLTQNAEAPIAGEAGTVTSLECSSDGMVFVSGDRTGSVTLWDLATFRLLKTFDGQLGPIDIVAFLPGGRRLFAADSTGDCRTWDMVNGSELHRYAGSGRPGGSYLRGENWSYSAVSSDGRLVLCSRPDRAMELRVIESGSVIRTFAAREHPITCVALSPDSRYALCGDEGGEIHYWRLDTGECLRSVRVGPKPGSVDCAAFSTDGKQALTGGHDLVVRLWDLSTGREIRRFTGPTLVVRSVRFGRGDRTVFSVGSDQTLRMWDARSGGELNLGAQLSLYGYALAVVPPGDAVLASSGPSISLWDISRSLCHLDLGSRLDAARVLLCSNPDDRDGLATLGRWYAFRGVNDWAVWFLEKARARGADIPSLTLARCYWQLDRTAEAAREFRNALVRREAPADYLQLCLNAVTGSRAQSDR